AGIKTDHLGGDLHQNLDATFVVKFLELFQSSADEVFGVRSTVIKLHVCKESRSTEAIPHRVGHKLAWINSPAVICIETDRFRRRLKHNRPTAKVGRRAELTNRHCCFGVLSRRGIRWGRKIERVVTWVAHLA